LRNPSRACQKGGLHGRIEAIRSWSIEPYLPQLIGTTRPAAETGGCSTRLGFHAVPVWSVANAAARGGPAFRERPLSLNVLWIVASAGWCLAGLSWSKHLPTGRTGAAVELPSGKVGPTPTGAARQIVRPSGRFLRTDISFGHPQKRLAKALLRLAEVQGAAQAVRPRITITQKELGRTIGLSRESTNKWLRDWETTGHVSLEKRGCTIDRDFLTMLATDAS
jgi:hypothetical protein